LEQWLEPSTWIAGRALGVGLLHFAMASGVTVHVLIHKRDVPAAIGWIGLAWLSPVVGALLYLGFGINRVKRRARKLKGPQEEADGLEAEAEFSADPFDRLEIAVGAITREEIAQGKVAAILENGDNAYPQMLSAIDGARSSIRLSTFIFRTDDAGELFIAALARAVQRGVKARVLIDGFGGGFLTSSAYRRLRKQGVPVARFLHSILPWKMPFLDLRLHKKCLVVDGRVAFVGGLNIGAENLHSRQPRKPVRDCHFQLVGEIVQQIEQQFDDDWSFAMGEAPLDFPPPPPNGDVAATARAIVSGPDQEIDPLPLVLLSAINAARRSIQIATPYFVPDEQLVTALQLAAMRGVKTRLALPAANNHRWVGWAARAHIRPLLLSGCQVWRSPPPFDHSKLMTIDGEWSLIGSANWDTRSFRLNFELCVEFYDRKLANALAGLIDARCVERTTLEEIDQRPLLVKLRDAAARLTMPYI